MKSFIRNTTVGIALVGVAAGCSTEKQPTAEVQSTPSAATVIEAGKCALTAAEVLTGPTAGLDAGSLSLGALVGSGLESPQKIKFTITPSIPGAPQVEYESDKPGGWSDGNEQGVGGRLATEGFEGGSRAKVQLSILPDAAAGGVAEYVVCSGYAVANDAGEVFTSALVVPE